MKTRTKKTKRNATPGLICSVKKNPSDRVRFDLVEVLPGRVYRIIRAGVVETFTGTEETARARLASLCNG